MLGANASARKDAKSAALLLCCASFQGEGQGHGLGVIMGIFFLEFSKADVWPLAFTRMKKTNWSWVVSLAIHLKGTLVFALFVGNLALVLSQVKD